MRPWPLVRPNGDVGERSSRAIGIASPRLHHDLRCAADIIQWVASHKLKISPRAAGQRGGLSGEELATVAPMLQSEPATGRLRLGRVAVVLGAEKSRAA
jgi:hypothetical protein